MQILDGRGLARTLSLELRPRIAEFTRRCGRPPGLAVVLVGQNPASEIYVRRKSEAAAAVGILSRIARPGDPQALGATLAELNRDPSVDGVLLQLPLPFPTAGFIDQIDPNKDVDGLTSLNLGRLWADRGGLLPCTPAGIVRLLGASQIDVRGMRAVVVGRSVIVGKPLAVSLGRLGATVTVCHSETRGLSEHTRAAELVVVAAGRPGLLGRGDFAENTVVVDVGIHRTPAGRLTGDVRLNELGDVLRAATPVPGGVGPMTIAMLLENTLTLAERRT